MIYENLPDGGPSTETEGRFEAETELTALGADLAEKLKEYIVPEQERDFPFNTREQAVEYVNRCNAQGIKVIISIPERYVTDVRKAGITPYGNQDRNNRGAIVGTLGREPFLGYKDESEPRHLALIDMPANKLHPRRTGPESEGGYRHGTNNYGFYGEVEIDERIPVSKITFLN